MSPPWMKFYPTDWRGDQGLRAVSLAARGLWIEMLMIMHEGDPYGYLVLGTRPVSTDVLSRMVGTSPLEIEQLIAELETAGVFNRTEKSGVIYSRRMTKDRQKANKCRKAAKTRWAQPTGSTQEKLRPNGSPNANGHGSFEDDLPPRSQTEVDNLLTSVPKESSLRSPKKKSMNCHGSPSAGHGSRLNASWQPSANDTAFAASLGLEPLRIATTVDRFRDYWLSAAGRSAVKRDWSAAWRNWVRKDVEDRSTGPPSEPVRYERDPLGNMRRVG
jgi:hypothetical protein